MAPDRSDDRFYRDLTPFDRFSDVVDLAAYAPVPADWVVMIADVQGSTEAIRQGRYKDVNMVGAAAIIAVLNVCGDVEVPFVFGGDGGTLVVPGSIRDAAYEALRGLQNASESMFGLALRVGAFAVSDLRAGGDDVRIRKYELSPGNYLAMFAGGGLERADSLLKDPAFAEPDTPSNSNANPDLEGLSCRWEPLVPKGGRMMSLMVQGRRGDPRAEAALLSQVLAAITGILGHDLTESAPASTFSMRFKWPPKGLRLEARASVGEQGYLRRYLAVLTSSLIQFWCERFDRKAGNYDAPAYRAELRANTDYRKYDGVLRTVLDVTPEQAAAIEQYLEREYRAGRLVYGLHLADKAMMTCLLFDLGKSEHVHFIDGADGGFAMAAAGFKSRLD
jgi:hypothetical protein